MTITVYGTPGPQGSKRFVGLSKAGRGIMIESSAAVKPWREAVLYAARESGVRIQGPVSMSVIFTLAKPKSAPKTRRTWPDKKPDLSKLVRSTEDALKDAGTIEDDARIVDCCARKVFPGEMGALDVPGAKIWLRMADWGHVSSGEPLSAYAFREYGHDAKLYGGIMSLELDAEVRR